MFSRRLSLVVSVRSTLWLELALRRDRFESWLRIERVRGRGPGGLRSAMASMIDTMDQHQGQQVVGPAALVELSTFGWIAISQQGEIPK